MPKYSSQALRPTALWDRIVASDPGLTRLRTATRGVVAMGTTLGVEYLVASAQGKSGLAVLIAMLLGAVVAMMSAMGMTGSVKNRLQTAALFPVAMGVGLTIGAAVGGNTDLVLGVFVAVLFAAVYVRRFGVPFFFGGFMAWMGYFFASFLGASFAQVPALAAAAAIAAAWVLLLSFTVLRENPVRALGHTLRGFGVRAEELADAAAALLADPDERRLRRLQRRQRRLDEAALMIEGQLDDTSVPRGRRPAEVRSWLVDAQLAADDVALACVALAEGPATAAAVRAAARGPVRLLAAGRTADAAAAAHSLDLGVAAGDEDLRHALRHVRTGVQGYAEAVRKWRDPQERHGADEREFAPALTLMMGRLPTSTAVASEVRPRSASWNVFARLPLTTRQAIQTAIAGGLAIAAGRALSSQRYYWAVIAAFIAFTGTATRGDTFVKAANRVLGTAVGLVAAVWFADLTAGSTPAVLAVILGSMFCGFYLFQISYAYMIFFITIMVAQLYSVLHEFSAGLLLLRLEETAIGGAIGMLVAAFVLPVGTRDTARAGREGFFSALQVLLDALRRRLAGEPIDDDPEGLARALETRLYELRQVLAPLTKPLSLRSDAAQIQARLAVYAAVATAGRGLAAATRALPYEPRPRLAEVTGALARTAEVLGADDDPDAALARATELLDQSRAALDAAEDADVRREIVAFAHAAGRLILALRRLAAPPDAAPSGIATPGHTAPLPAARAVGEDTAWPSPR